MKIIGLCGRSGSGKSTAAKYMKSRGCDVISADAVSREVMGAGSPCLDELASFFGDDIINGDGTLNRRLLASRAFADREGATALNSITHKYIVDRINTLINGSKAQCVVIDAPLLFEAGLQEKCAAVIGIIAPDVLCVSRAAARDGITEDEVAKRLSNQHGNDFLLTFCTHIINNSGSLDELEAAVDKTLAAITEDGHA